MYFYTTYCFESRTFPTICLPLLFAVYQVTVSAMYLSERVKQKGRHICIWLDTFYRQYLIVTLLQSVESEPFTCAALTLCTSSRHTFQKIRCGYEKIQISQFLRVSQTAFLLKFSATEYLSLAW